MAITTLVSAALPEGLEAELPAAPGPEPAELDLGALAAELELDDSWLEADEGAARRELRRQIGRLEAELAGYSRELAPAGEPPARPREPRVAGVAELADHPRRAARPARRRRAPRRWAGRARERRAREVRDAMVADPAGHRWEVVLVGRHRRGGMHDLGGRARGWGPLGALMNWWRIKVSGGCPLAVRQARADGPRNR